MRFSIVFLLLAALAFPTNASAQLAWTLSGTPDKIQTSTTTGSNVQDLWTSGTPSTTSPWGLAVVPSENAVYWSDLQARTVNRIGLDGSNFQTLFNYSTSAVQSLAVDSQNSQLFFVATTSSAIIRSNYTGTSQSSLVTLSPTNAWITFDPVNRYLYYSESNANRIARVNVDGTPVIQSVVTLSAGNGVRGIALDGHGNLYWVDNTTDTLSRVDLNSYTGTPLSGSVLLNLTTLTNNANATPNGLTSDGQYLFWAEGSTNARGIYRTDLTGSNGVRLTTNDSTVSPIGVSAIMVAVPEPASIALLSMMPILACGILYRRRWIQRRAASWQSTRQAR